MKWLLKQVQNELEKLLSEEIMLMNLTTALRTTSNRILIWILLFLKPNLTIHPSRVATTIKRHFSYFALFDFAILARQFQAYRSLENFVLYIKKMKYYDLLSDHSSQHLIFLSTHKDWHLKLKNGLSVNAE